VPGKKPPGKIRKTVATWVRGCDTHSGATRRPSRGSAQVTEGNICNTHEFRHVTAMHKKDAASIALMAWMLTVSNLMAILYDPDLKYFIAATLVGFFIIVYIIHPVFSKPRYIRNIYRMGITCAALFSLVIFLRILELVEYFS